MERQEKKGKKKAALLLGLALALTAGITSAYLADVSGLITNEFDPEWVYTDVDESGDQQYDIVPGTDEEKDPRVKVNNSVDAYVYLIVTDKVNANGKVVDYTIDPMWTKMDKDQLGDIDLKDKEGNPIVLGDNDTIYYAVAPKTADGEASEVRDVEDGDNADYELSYPVLVGDRVYYSSDLTNEELAQIKDPDNILSFRSYAIQRHPFIDMQDETLTEKEREMVGAIDALHPIDAAKAAAKAAIERAAGNNPSPEVQAILDEYNKANGTIDKQTSINDVEAKKQEAINKINQQKAKEDADAELADAKEAAKKAIEAAAGDNPSPEVQAILDEYNKANGTIDKQDSVADVNAKKQEAIDKINAQKAEELADAKEDAKKAIDNAAGENPSEAVQKAADDAKAAIDNATTPEAVEAAKDAGVKAIEDAKLADAKEDAKKAIDDAAGDNPSEAVQKAADDAKAAIDNATTPEAVEAAKDAGVKAIEDAKLADAKEDAKKAIDDAAGENPSEAVQKAADDAKAAIDNATTPEAVEAAKDAGVKAIEDAKLADAKEDAKKAIDDAAGDNPSEAVQKAADDAKAAIDNATTPEAVEAAKDAGVKAIEDAKLADAKEDAKKAIDDAAGENPSEAVQKAADDAKAAIDNATTPEAVEAAKEAGVKAIEDAKLADAKADAKKAIDNAAGENPSEAVQKAAEDAKAAIEAAKTPEEVAAAKDAGVKAIEDAKLADAKADAKKAIDNAAGENPSEAVQKAADDAKAAIEAAETPEAVEAAKTAGIMAIEAAKAKELADAKIAAKAALLEKLNSYDPEEGNAHGNNAQNAAYADAIAAIDNATTLEAVDEETEAGIKAIEAAVTPSIAEINKQLKEKGLNIEIVELAGYMNWDDAAAYATAKGGRLASSSELRAVYDIDRKMSPRPIRSEMTSDASYAWTKSNSSGPYADGVGFDSGYTMGGFKTDNRFVIVVRDLV